MQKEILALFGVCFAAAVGELLLPATAQLGTRKALRLLTSLLVLLLILTPFLRVLRNQDALFGGEIDIEEPSAKEFETIFENAMQSQSETDLKNGLLSLLQKEYGIKESDCQIFVYFKEGGELQSVSLFLSGDAIKKDPLAIERDLSARLGCEVEVR